MVELLQNCDLSTLCLSFVFSLVKVKEADLFRVITSSRNSKRKGLKSSKASSVVLESSIERLNYYAVLLIKRKDQWILSRFAMMTKFGHSEHCIFEIMGQLLCKITETLGPFRNELNVFGSEKEFIDSFMKISLVHFNMWNQFITEKFEHRCKKNDIRKWNPNEPIFSIIKVPIERNK